MKHNRMARLWAWILALALVCPAAPMGAWALESEDTILIETAEDLRDLAQQCRLDTWSRGKTVELKRDISLDGIAFEPVPSFGGTFHGNGHTISGLSLSGNDAPAGLFGVIQQDGVVEDLNVSGSVFPGGKAEHVGGIAGENHGTIRNCTFVGSVTGKINVGGIAGTNCVTGTISHCTVDGALKGQKKTGGIAGCNLGRILDSGNQAYVNVSNADTAFRLEDIEINLVLDLSKAGSIDTQNAATDTGGIAGYSSGTLEQCENAGIIGYPHVGYGVGGIAGKSCGYVFQCENTGAIYGRKDVGGIVGQMEPFLAVNITESALSILQKQLDELDGLLDQALEDAGSGMNAMTGRLNAMAGNVGGASAALRDIKTTASIEGNVSGSGESSAGGSVTLDPSDVEVNGGGGAAGGAGASGGAGIVIVPGAGASGGGVSAGGGIVSGGELDVDIGEGSVNGEGGGSVNGSLSAGAQITMTTSLGGVASSLAGLANQMRLLSGEVAGVTGTLETDIKAIDDKINEISDTASDLLFGEREDIIVDSSDVDIDRVTLGKAHQCVNEGQVNGDISVGGVAGSMALEHEMDPEEDALPEWSNEERRRYEIKAIIQDCSNYGAITAKRNYSGGICGQMNLGLIALSGNYGTVSSENGSYVGGVAGIAGSIVRHCFAKCTLSGKNYVGGICGDGVGEDVTGGTSTVAGCYSMVEIPSCEQFFGAISGSDAGSFLENYFVSDTLAGINGRSFAGRAEPVPYSSLLTMKRSDALPQENETDESTESTESSEPGETETAMAAEGEVPETTVPEITLPDEFRSMTLTFVIDEEVVKEVPFDYGDSFDESVYPEIPEKDGYYARWDRDTLENLKFDTVVTAVYTAYTTAMDGSKTRESGREIFFVQGQFQHDAEVTVEALAKTPSAIGVLSGDWTTRLGRCFTQGKIYQDLVEQWKITIPEDGNASHTIRYLDPGETGKHLTVFLKTGGTWSEVDSEVIGSYIVFQAQGNEVEAAIVSCVNAWWVWLFPAALAAAIAALILCLIRGIRKRAHRTAPPKSSGGQGTPPPEEKKKKRWIIPLAIVLGILLAAGIWFGYSFTHSGMAETVEAARLIQADINKGDLSMELSVKVDSDGQESDFVVQIDQVKLDGQKVTVIRQNGNALYYCGNAVYLENGRGYALSPSYPNFGTLLDRTLALYRLVDISVEDTGGGKTYSITADGENAEAVLELLVPDGKDAVSGMDSLNVQLAESGGDLREIRFQSAGTLAQPFRLDAVLTIKGASSAVLPEMVQDAIADGAGETTAVVTEDLMALLSGWNTLEEKTLIGADLTLSADCGPLKLNETLRLFRDSSTGTDIYEIQKNGFQVFFTEDKICSADGLSVSAEHGSLTSSAELLDIAYELCMEAEFSASDGVYSIALDEKGMERVASAIAPERANLDVRFESGVLRITLSEGEIQSMEFEIDGSVKVVAADVPVRFAGGLTFFPAEPDSALPEAVIDALGE